jgi:hypothetical protein
MYCFKTASTQDHELFIDGLKKAMAGRNPVFDLYQKKVVPWIDINHFEILQTVEKVVASSEVIASKVKDIHNPSLSTNKSKASPKTHCTCS